MCFQHTHVIRAGILAMLLNECFVFAGELRPLSTDRPDTTESPMTVDSGHFQFEVELGSWTKDGGERSFSLFELNAKAGLNPMTDLQVVMPFYSRVQNGDEGFGDVEIRLKRNLWGNDNGSTAFAMMPFIKLPTAKDELGNGEVEGGLILPFGFDGPAGWACAIMAEVDVELDDDGHGYHPLALVSATTGHELSESTEVFFEWVGALDMDSETEEQAWFNTGMTWEVRPMWQIDWGVRIGLTDSAEDITPFVGFSFKL